MVQKINTGNYRICRNKIGIASSNKIIETGNKDTIAKSWETMEKDYEFDYYREEEVIYKGSQTDQNGNPINSAPSWIRY
jgi:hypothetical protein